MGNYCSDGSVNESSEINAEMSLIKIKNENSAQNKHPFLHESEESSSYDRIEPKSKNKLLMNFGHPRRPQSKISKVMLPLPDHWLNSGFKSRSFLLKNRKFRVLSDGPKTILIRKNQLLETLELPEPLSRWAKLLDLFVSTKKIWLIFEGYEVEIRVQYPPKQRILAIRAVREVTGTFRYRPTDWKFYTRDRHSEVYYGSDKGLDSIKLVQSHRSRPRIHKKVVSSLSIGLSGPPKNWQKFGRKVNIITSAYSVGLLAMSSRARKVLRKVEFSFSYLNILGVFGYHKTAKEGYSGAGTHVFEAAEDNKDGVLADGGVGTKNLSKLKLFKKFKTTEDRAESAARNELSDPKKGGRVRRRGSMETREGSHLEYVMVDFKAEIPANIAVDFDGKIETCYYDENKDLLYIFGIHSVVSISKALLGGKRRFAVLRNFGVEDCPYDHEEDSEWTFRARRVDSGGSGGSEIEEFEFRLYEGSGPKKVLKGVRRLKLAAMVIYDPNEQPETPGNRFLGSPKTPTLFGNFGEKSQKMATPTKSSASRRHNQTHHIPTNAPKPQKMLSTPPKKFKAESTRIQPSTPEAPSEAHEIEDDSELTFTEQNWTLSFKEFTKIEHKQSNAFLAINPQSKKIVAFKQSNETSGRLQSLKIPYSVMLDYEEGLPLYLIDRETPEDTVLLYFTEFEDYSGNQSVSIHFAKLDTDPIKTVRSMKSYDFLSPYNFVSGRKKKFSKNSKNRKFEKNSKIFEKVENFEKNFLPEEIIWFDKNSLFAFKMTSEYFDGLYLFNGAFEFVSRVEFPSLVKKIFERNFFGCFVKQKKFFVGGFYNHSFPIKQSSIIVSFQLKRSRTDPKKFAFKVLGRVLNTRIESQKVSGVSYSLDAASGHLSMLYKTPTKKSKIGENSPENSILNHLEPTRAQKRRPVLVNYLFRVFNSSLKKHIFKISLNQIDSNLGIQNCGFYADRRSLIVKVRGEGEAEFVYYVVDFLLERCDFMMKADCSHVFRPANRVYYDRRGFFLADAEGFVQGYQPDGVSFEVKAFGVGGAGGVDDGVIAADLGADGARDEDGEEKQVLEQSLG